MSKKVYVGNISFNWDSAKLKEVFGSFGAIEEANVIQNKFSGRSKGFGFVVFTNDEDADKAIAETNDKEFDGRTLKVSEATPFDPEKPRPPRRDFGGQRRSFGGGNRNFGRRDRF